MNFAHGKESAQRPGSLGAFAHGATCRHLCLFSAAPTPLVARGLLELDHAHGAAPMTWSRPLAACSVSLRLPATPHRLGLVLLEVLLVL